jgi:hypothetical protein
VLSGQDTLLLISLIDKGALLSFSPCEVTCIAQQRNTRIRNNHNALTACTFKQEGSDTAYLLLRDFVGIRPHLLDHFKDAKYDMPTIWEISIGLPTTSKIAV